MPAPEPFVWDDEYCPERGAGLKHIVGSQTGQCPYCGLPCGYAENRPVVATASRVEPKAAHSAWMPAQPPAPDDPAFVPHVFRWTLANKCAACGRLELDHVKFVSEPDENGCRVDHSSLRGSVLISDDGLDRTVCICGRIIEGKYATGKAEGPSWGRGRGALSPRDRQRLVGRVEFGEYLADHGGGEVE